MHILKFFPCYVFPYLIQIPLHHFFCIIYTKPIKISKNVSFSLTYPQSQLPLKILQFLSKSLLLKHLHTIFLDTLMTIPNNLIRTLLLSLNQGFIHIRFILSYRFLNSPLTLILAHILPC